MIILELNNEVMIQILQTQKNGKDNYMKMLQMLLIILSKKTMDDLQRSM